jgi:hypothetical protein
MFRPSALIGLLCALSILCLSLAPAGAQGSILRQVPVPDAHIVEVNPLLGRVYVGGLGSLTVLDSTSYQVITTLPDVFSWYSALDLKLGKLYLVDVNTGVIRVLNGLTNTWLPDLNIIGAFDVDVHTTDNRVFASAGSAIKVFNGLTGALLTSIEIPDQDDLRDVVVNPVTNRLYVEGFEDVIILDLNTYSLVGSFPIIGAWSYFEVNPITNQFYALIDEIDEDTIIQVDLNTNTEVSAEWFTGTEILNFTLNPLTERLYIVGQTLPPLAPAGRFQVVNLNTWAVLDTETLGTRFIAAASDSLTSRVYLVAQVPPPPTSAVGNRLVAFQDAGPNFNQSPTRNFWLVPPTLTWSAVSGATRYQVMVDNSPAFNSPEFTQVTPDGNTLQVTTPELPDGLYYWRVQAERNGAWGGWSAVDTLVVDD